METLNRHGLVAKLTRKWIIVLLCFALLLIGAGIQNAFAVFFLPMLREFNWSMPSLALAMTINGLIAGFSQPIIGWVVEKHRPKTIILAGAAVAGASVLMLAFASSLWHVYLLYGVVFGFACISSCMIATTALVTRWFAERRSLVLTFFQSAFMLGGFLIVPTAGWLILSYGWRHSWLILGTAFLLIVLVAVFLLKEPETVQTEVLRSENGAVTSLANLKDRFFPLLLVIFFICGSTDVPFSNLWIPISLELGVEEVAASYTLGLMGALAFIGTILVGSLPEKFGNKMPFTLSYVIRTIALLIPVLPIKSMTTYYAFATLMGLSTFGMVPVVSAWLGDVYGSRSVGKLFGILNFIHHISSSTGIYLFSFIAETYKTYSPIFLAGLILCVINVVFCLLVKPSGKGVEKGML
ncbi:MAG: MFS transporter [Candidatus Bathyarchaeia archaeon]